MLCLIMHYILPTPTPVYVNTDVLIYVHEKEIVRLWNVYAMSKQHVVNTDMLLYIY